MGLVHSKQQQLASSVASSTAASAPKPWGMRGGTAGAAAEAAAAATAPAQERDDLLHLLDEHMARWWVYLRDCDAGLHVSVDMMTSGQQQRT
jgi:hypothetical protein